MDRLIRLVFLFGLLLAPSVASPQTSCGTLSNCTNASIPLSGTELMYLVQGGISKRVTASNFIGQNILSLNNVFTGANTFTQNPIFSSCPLNYMVLGGGSLALGCFNSAFTFSSANGVYCDNIHDDTSAINTLIASLTSGGEVLLGPGICKISGSINLLSNVLFHCVKGTAIITGLAPSYPAISAASGVSDAEVAHCTINGNSTIAGTRTADGIYFQSGSIRGKVWDNTVFATSDNGIESDGQGTEIYSNYVTGCYTNGIYVVGATLASPAAYINIHDNYVVTNSVGTTTWDGIDIDGDSKFVTVNHNTVVGNDVILFESGSVSSVSSGHQVTNNTIISSIENGIDVGPASGSFALQSMLVSGNTIYNSTNNGIVILRTVTGSTISNNTIIGPTAAGISFNTSSVNPPSDDLVTGNKINNPSSVSGAHSGIEVLNSAFDLQISNNKISDTRGSVLMKYAIDTGSAAANRTVIIQNNNVQTGTSGVINVLATQVARDNPGFNPVGALSNPIFPGSTSPLTNPFPYPVRVFINPTVAGGSITTVAINGTSTGTLSGEFTLQPNDTITVTYTGTPSWQWFGS